MNKVFQSALREIDGVGAHYSMSALTDSQMLNLEIIDFAQLVEDVLALQKLACRAIGISVTIFVRMRVRRCREVGT